MVGSPKVLVALAALALLAACDTPVQNSESPDAGSGTPASESGTPPDDPLTYLDYSCYGEGPAYNLSDPYDLDEIPDGAKRLMDRVSKNGIEIGDPTDARRWDPVYRTDKTVVFLKAAVRIGFYRVVEVRRQRKGRWSLDGSGHCELWATPLHGRPSADWSLTKDPEPSDRELHVVATEMACTGGRKLAPKEFRPVVHYEEARISVVMYSQPVGGGTCPGNPSTRVTIELDEPVGEREIYDVGPYPPWLEAEGGDQ